MKRKKLYIAILLLAGVLTSCKVGKSYVRPDLHLPDSLERADRKSTRLNSSHPK